MEPGRVLRVVTYNIHQCLNADMVVNLPAIAVAIPAEQPDIVVLNEVNQGRATNGFIDVLAYLSQGLDIPFVTGASIIFFITADLTYGQAWVPETRA